MVSTLMKITRTNTELSIVMFLLLAGLGIAIIL